MTTLQQFCDQHPNGTATNPTVIDLGGKIWPVEAPGVDAEYPFVLADTRQHLKLDNGTILGGPTALNHRPAVLVRGTGITFGSKLVVHNNGPDAAHYSFSHEFGHGIELQGATGFTTEPGCLVTNSWGSGVFVTKRNLGSSGPGRWTTGLKLQHDSAHHGRQHVAMDAVDGWNIIGGLWRNCAHAATVNAMTTRSTTSAASAHRSTGASGRPPRTAEPATASMTARATRSPTFRRST